MTQIYNPKDYYLTDYLEALYPKIRREYMTWNRFCKKIRYRSFHAIDLEKTGSWSGLQLMQRFESIWHRKWLFPTTFDLIYRLPVCENLSFSIFKPGTEIIPHQGWSNHFVRFHLGIDCNDQSCLVLENQTLPEQNGKVIMFDDSQTHYAYNHGTTDRVVLLFDMLKSDVEKYRK
jgi:aspartyl/asparaginyl beta-hydroxylase (cupin superfamily)